jgi:hypothetical protein
MYKKTGVLEKLAAAKEKVANDANKQNGGKDKDKGRDGGSER